MQFKKVIGQQAIKDRLIKTVLENRISHAQLFAGSEGRGKLAMALAYAQYIGCTNKIVNDSCGECASCVKIEKLAHPDLHFVFPVITATGGIDEFIGNWRARLIQSPYLSYNEWLNLIGSENKQGLISKKESEEIIKKLSFKTYESQYKIMIIWLPEKMNHVAANKLLKILEEPWEYTIFILVSNQQDSLLPTILSRTQTIQFPPIDTLSMNEKLISSHQLSEEQAREYAQLSQGSYLKAQELIASSDDNKANFDLFVQWMRLAYQKNITEILPLSESLASLGREKQKQFLSYCLLLVRESFTLNQMQEELVRLSAEEFAFTKKFSPFIHSGNIEAIYQNLNDAYWHIERNGNAKIIFLDTSLRTIQLLHS